MHICDYTLVRIHIIENMHYCVPDSSGSGLDRICILVHRGQQIHIIFVNMDYNHFFMRSLNPDSHY